MPPRPFRAVTYADIHENETNVLVLEEQDNTPSAAGSARFGDISEGRGNMVREPNRKDAELCKMNVKEVKCVNVVK
jgi:hypothetical protein